jgi:hypothetical protein
MSSQAYYERDGEASADDGDSQSVLARPIPGARPTVSMRPVLANRPPPRPPSSILSSNDNTNFAKPSLAPKPALAPRPSFANRAPPPPPVPPPPPPLEEDEEQFLDPALLRKAQVRESSTDDIDEQPHAIQRRAPKPHLPIPYSKPHHATLGKYAKNALIHTLSTILRY